MVIYADILFFTNFLMDALLLATTAILSDRKAIPWRMALGAGVGALFGCLLFYQRIHWLLLFSLKATIPALVLWIAFPFETRLSYFKSLLLFLGVHLLFGGGMYGFYALTDAGSKMRQANGIYYMEIPLWLLLLMAFCFYGLSRLFFHVLDQRKQKNFLHTLVVNSTPLQALLDTGNALYDPLTLKPVIICQWDALPLPEDLLQAVLHQDASALPNLCEKYPHLHLQLLPYTDIGGKRILIYGFRPHELTIDGTPHRAIIGLTLQPLSPDNRFQALLHRDWSHL